MNFDFVDHKDDDIPTLEEIFQWYEKKVEGIINIFYDNPPEDDDGEYV